MRAGAVLALTDAGAVTCVEEDEAPLSLLVCDETDGAVAAFTFVGAAKLVVELPLHEHPLALEVVTDGAVCACTVVGAATDVAEELVPFVPVLDELVTTEGAEAALTFVGAETVVAAVFWL